MYRKGLYRSLYALMLWGCILLCGCAGKDNGGTADVPEDTGPGAQVNEQYVDEIRQRGYLAVGCKTDVPGLGFYDTQTKEWSGLETELAWQTAARMFDVSVDDAKEQRLVRFTGVTVADREQKLESGEVDCLFATYTVTSERKKRFAFSESYYTDYIGMMVKSDGDQTEALGNRGIRSIADLDGKYIGVPQNATTRRAFINYIDTMSGIRPSPVFMEYESYEALFRALKQGEIDVMAEDVSILNGYVDSTTRILGDRFGGQHYAAAVKQEHTPLLEYVNEVLAGQE